MDVPRPGPGIVVPPGLPAGGQRRRLHLAGTRGQVARGRDFTRQALVDWHWLTERGHGGPGAGEDVLLLVSELLANACLHAGGPHALLLDASAERLRIEVADGSGVLPAPRLPHEPGRPGGHGLHVVQRLSDRWGATLTADGKTVWLEIAVSRLGSAV